MSCMADYGAPVFSFLAVGGYQSEWLSAPFFTHETPVQLTQTGDSLRHHASCFFQMTTTPVLRLSSWPSPSTTILAATPSSKWLCSGRQSFLKLSRPTRKTLPPTSPLHTWQRYSKICCWPAVTARGVLKSLLFFYHLTILTPLNPFLLSVYRGLWRMRLIGQQQRISPSSWSAML